MNWKISQALLLLVLTAFLGLGASTAEAGDRKLAFAVSGVVETLNVKAGDKIAAGSVLARLDQTPFKARKRAADVAAASAKLIVDLAAVKLEQMRELFDALSTSQEEVEKAEIAHANALASYESAKAKAEIAAWRLARASLVAPFAGTVSAVPGYPGMVVNIYAGSSAVVVVKTP